MTDRVKGCWVAFDGDIREDDVECIVNAIMMVKHVSAVTTSRADPEDWMNREMVKSQVEARIHEAMDEIFHPEIKKS